MFFTVGAVDALPISSDAPYVVAISPNGLIVGSASFAATDLIGGQQSLAVWGDDAATPEIDGALNGEAIIFQLVDGNYLYDLNFTSIGPSSYTSNGTLPVIGASAELNCVAPLSGCTDSTACNYSDSAEVDDGSCVYCSITNDMFIQPVNTGANMTIGINVSKFDQFANGGQIGAFYDLDGDGTLECVGLQYIYTEFLDLIRGVMTHLLLN